MASTSEHITHKGAQGFGFSALLEAAKSRVGRHLMYRKTVNELSALSARELDDLGLNRSMIRQVALQAVNEHFA